jgi:lysozyme
MLEVSNKGLLEICEHEGIVPGPYWDSVNMLTYGIGHTASAGGLDPHNLKKGMPEDVDLEIMRAIQVFKDDIKKFEARVRKAFPVPLKQHQFDALVSWDFNTGGATWKSKSGKPCRLVQEVNSGNFSGEGFMGWLKPISLRKRREAEMRLFLTGDYDHNGDSIPIYKVDDKGNLAGRYKIMKGAELLKLMGRKPASSGKIPGKDVLAAIMSTILHYIGKMMK